MPTFKDSFPGAKAVFFVAIHVGLVPADTARDVDVAHDEGADGVFLIKDYTTIATDDDVMLAYRQARRKHALDWMGVNLLDHSAQDGLRVLATDHVQGFWFDRAYVVRDADYLASVRKLQETLRPSTLLFPSIAFKYQERVTSYARVVRLAEPYTDTIVTSGEATGVAADIDKIRIMRTETKLPLGLASGVSADNVESFLQEGVDFFIVNTSISNDNGRLDPGKVRALRAKIPAR